MRFCGSFLGLDLELSLFGGARPVELERCGGALVPLRDLGALEARGADFLTCRGEEMPRLLSEVPPRLGFDCGFFEVPFVSEALFVRRESNFVISKPPFLFPSPALSVEFSLTLGSNGSMVAADWTGAI